MRQNDLIVNITKYVGWIEWKKIRFRKILSKYGSIQGELPTRNFDV